MDEICSTCLSKHRAPVLVCWECSSRLQKMQEFKSQATKAQEVLKRYLENKEPLKALRSLSRLSISGTKTGYDENFEFCLKQETVECEDLPDDFRDVEYLVEYRTEVIDHIPKAEKIDTDNQVESLSKRLHVTVERLSGSGDKERTESDVWSPPQDRNKQVITNKKVKKESDIKKEPKKEFRIKQNGRKLSEPEKNFTIKKMKFEELHRLREEDRKNGRYLSYPFKCRSCITGYVLEEKYNAHLQMNHSEEIGPHTCDICLTRHARADQLARHRETHLYRYHCRECPFTSHKQQWMLAHQSEHKAETFKCGVCGFSTNTEGRLRYHRNKTHKKLPTCHTCGKQFASGNSLKQHMQMHGPAKREKCAVCGGMYKFLRIHARTHAPPAPDAFCVECGVRFKTKYSLRKHLLVHSKHIQQSNVQSLKCHVCDECGYRSMNKTNMERHKVAQHTKQYPFSCDICLKGFYRRDKLKYHILERHEGGEMPRKKMCSYCGKAFKTKQTLVNHIRTHTGEKPFKCALCPWSFAQRVTLRTHMRGKHPGADAGNTGGAGGSGNTENGGKAKSEKAARNSRNN